jgi:hypothetical protein
MNTHTPPPGEAQGALYLPTDITPEEVFQAIGRLRKEARDEIHRLILFLDKTDDYVSRELEDQVDDGPCDDNELEPSLCGVTVAQKNMAGDGNGSDLEGDAHEDGEPMLGWTEPQERGQQAMGSNGTEAEQGSTCPGDLRKGRARYRKRDRSGRQNRDGMHVTVEQQGYGGYVKIRNLTEAQQEALAPKIDRASGVSTDKINTRGLL